MEKGQQGICSIAVQGFKSLAKESRIEIRPLTILAGANSSGKSVRARAARGLEIR